MTDLDAVLATIDQGVVIWGPDGSAWRWNRLGADLLYVDPRSLGGCSFDDARWSWTDEDGDPLGADEHPVARARNTGMVSTDVIVTVEVAGRSRRLRCSTYPYSRDPGPGDSGPGDPGPGDSGTAVVMALVDLELDRLGAADLALRATTDSLTALPNRALLLDRLDQMLRRARRSRSPVCALYCDVDNFKRVNDELGHASGDEVLYELARRLEATVRDGDTVARMGGDEFVIACPDLAPEPAVANLATRISTVMAQPFVVEGWPGRTEVTVSLSIGVAGSDPGDTPLDLLRRADLAMYQAKESGRDQIRAFDSTMLRSTTRRSHLESELAAAVERDQLVVHYRPIVAVDTGRIVGVESVLGWDHPTRGLVPSEEFVVFAGQVGLMRSINRWVFDQALADLASWRGDPRLDAAELFVTVDVTGRDLTTGNLPAELGEVLASYRLPARALVLEVDERVFVDQAGAATRATQALVELGVGLALDRFGTGLAPLRHLVDGPPDMVKLDPGLVAGAGSDDRRRRILEAVVQLAEAAGVTTLAQGVDDAARAALAAEVGCRLAQGDHYAAAGTPAAVAGALVAG